MTDWHIAARWDFPTKPPMMNLSSRYARRVPGESDRIVGEVARRWGLTVKELVGKRRTRRVAWARFEACYRLRMECDWLSLPMIGRKLGGRDHTSILHGIRRYQELMASGSLDAVFEGRKAAGEPKSGGGNDMSPTTAAAPNNEA